MARNRQSDHHRDFHEILFRIRARDGVRTQQTVSNGTPSMMSQTADDEVRTPRDPGHRKHNRSLQGLVRGVIPRFVASGIYSQERISPDGEVRSTAPATRERSAARRGSLDARGMAAG